MAQFRPAGCAGNHLTYSPYVLPVVIDGVRGIVVDLRLRYQIDRQWSAAFGIDNLNNEQYWNFHPYPQRTYTAQLRFDL